MNLIWIFLPIIIWLGVITSYEDVKKEKIRNKWIIIALIISFCIHVILYSLQIIDVRYISKIVIFLFFSLIIGFLLYILGIWSAGDAKLFAGYASLVPLTTYTYFATSFWPMAILVNTFVPVFLLLVIYLLFKTTLKHKIKVLKKILHPKNVGQYLLVIFSVGWISMLIFNYFEIKRNFLLNVLMIMGLFWLIRKIYNHDINYLLGFIALLRIFINKTQILTINFWEGFLLMTLTYMVIIMFLRELGQIFITKTNIGFLKEGMIPIQGILKNKNDYSKTRFGIYSPLSKKNKNLIYQQKIEGLNKKDIKKIKKLYTEGKFHFNHILIQQTIPFAFFMFLGVILVLLFEGNLLLWLKAVL